MKQYRLVILIALFGAVVIQGAAFGKGSIIDSPHNLSASGKFAVKYQEEERICIFCHTPHAPKESMLPTDGRPYPLWGHALSNPAGGWTPYDSTTLHERPSANWVPTGSSRLCLSCHDGTVAIGNYLGSPIKADQRMPTNVTDPTKSPNFGTDLSGHHPISFLYPVSSELVDKGALPPAIKLDQRGYLECGACHDPHDNEFGNFLVMDNSSATAPLCIACHIPTGYDQCSHNPQNSSTLSPSGCMGCHVVHNAPVTPYLLHNSPDGYGCLVSGCHDGSNPQVANIKLVVNSNLTPQAGIGANSRRISAVKNGTVSYHGCVDCHNPHQSKKEASATVLSRTISGPLRGVRGVTRNSLVTVVAREEYEICFRCHSGATAGKMVVIGADPPPNRMIRELDQLRRFDGANPSFHPVTADRRSNGASLLGQYQTTMIRIKCSDCHNSDRSKKAGGSGPNGPHGSSFQYLLMARYEMPVAGMVAGGSDATLYDLCFRCHSETYIMGPFSGFMNGRTNEHAAHVRDRMVPCYVCHDPHGVSARDGATRLNNANLINFERSFTTGAGVMRAVYTSKVGGSGSCTVKCHSGGSYTHSYGP